jgi:hypothetical protein
MKAAMQAFGEGAPFCDLDIPNMTIFSLNDVVPQYRGPSTVTGWLPEAIER